VVTLLVNACADFGDVMTSQSIASNTPCGIQVRLTITVSKVAQLVYACMTHAHTRESEVWLNQHSLIGSDLAYVYMRMETFPYYEYSSVSLGLGARDADVMG
jgi:hypothetical protein